MSELDNERWDDRFSRLRTEVEQEGISVADDLAGNAILEEVLHARLIKVHEGIRPPYGALVCRSADLSELGGEASELAEPDALRPFADGRTAVLFRDVDNVTSGRLVRCYLPDELAALQLARRTRGIVVQRHESGTITITSGHEILINEMFRWRTRPVASDWVFEARDYLKLSGDNSLLVFTRLLDFAFHQLSPRNIGATIVLKLEGSEGYESLALDHAGYDVPLAISFLQDSDAEIMATFLRIVDGACIVEPDGRLIRTQAKLAVRASTSQMLSADRGTRHSSAKWFSFDHPKVVVFVVSADGPVSVYSDGVKVDLLKRYVEKEPSALTVARDQASELRSDSHVAECTQCERLSEIRYVGHPDANSTLVVSCPICDNEIGPVSAFWARATPLKPWDPRPAAPRNSPAI